MTRFSVIIPTHNRSHRLVPTLRSFLDLQYPAFELIVVDDGSSDDTRQVIEGLNDPRIRYFWKKNGERGAARNFGAAQATGEYLNFFDSDDFALSGFFTEAEKCIREFGGPEVFALGLEVRDDAQRLLRVVKDLPDPVNDRIAVQNFFAVGGVFVRRDIWTEFPFEEDLALTGSEDWLLWMRLAARYPFRYWNHVAWVYIDHGENSVYGMSEPKLRRRVDKMLDMIGADPDYMRRFGSRFDELIAIRHLYVALHLAMAGGVGRPLLYLARAVTVHPGACFRNTTLGALKWVLLNVVRRNPRTFRPLPVD
jgi:glycosyltransferase involved in cell wall biosynthesis